MAWFTLEACGHGRRFSGLQRIKERRGVWRSLGPPNHILSYLICARTHSHTAARVRRLARTPSPPPTKLVLWSLSQLGPIKDSQDESITSSTRARASSLQLIILSCQVKQPSAAAPLVEAASTSPGSECSVSTGEGPSIDHRNCAFVTYI